MPPRPQWADDFARRLRRWLVAASTARPSLPAASRRGLRCHRRFRLLRQPLPNHCSRQLSFAPRCSLKILDRGSSLSGNWYPQDGPAFLSSTMSERISKLTAPRQVSELLVRNVSPVSGKGQWGARRLGDHCIYLGSTIQCYEPPSRLLVRAATVISHEMLEDGRSFRAERTGYIRDSGRPPGSSRRLHSL